MLYITAKQAAEQWGITVRRVQDMCRNNQLPGSVRHGRDWMIPLDAVRPTDRRRKEVTPTEAIHKLPRRNPAIVMSNLYTKPGTADAVTQALHGQPEAAELFRAQIAFCRGNTDTAYNLCIKLLEKPCTHDLQIGCGIMLGMTAICRGDLQLWEQAKQTIRSAPCHDRKDAHLSEFWLAAVESEIFGIETFPQWLIKGSFDPLPGDSYPAARYYYLKYLYVLCHEHAVGHRGERDSQSMMRIFPLICEPLISQTRKDGALVAEIYLRLICAVAYHDLGNNEESCHQLDAAIALALPDRLYLILAEHCRQLDFLMDERLMLADPEAAAQVKALSHQYHDSWTKLHNIAMSRTVSNMLTTREREVAKHAAFGLSNKEIAQRLHISVNTVKQALRTAMDKTGAVRRSDLSRFI